MLLKNQLLLTVLGLFLLSAPGFAAVKAVKPVQEKEIKEAVREVKEEWKSMSRKERKVKRKEMRKEIKAAIRAHRAADADTDTLLLVIITIILPPLGMALYEGGITNRFWISLLLTLLFYLPGLIYTLIIILGER